MCCYCVKLAFFFGGSDLCLEVVPQVIVSGVIEEIW